MEFQELAIEGLVLIKPKVFSDERGYFMEAYNQRLFHKAGIEHEFVQDNQSQSVKNCIRGLHYQVNQWQAKLVRCIEGEIFDVGVDIRPESPTYGKWCGAVLSAGNRHQLFVPEGFAHGFSVLSDTAQVLYKCSNFYSPQDERGLMWNDPAFAIDWQIEGDPILSQKDRDYPSFENIQLT